MNLDLSEPLIPSGGAKMGPGGRDPEDGLIDSNTISLCKYVRIYERYVILGRKKSQI